MKQSKKAPLEFNKDREERATISSKVGKEHKIRSKLMEAALKEVENMDKTIKH